jgi:hypothetical protein
MKRSFKLLLALLFSLALVIEAIGQDLSWENRIASGFYSKIGGTHQFECCTKGSKTKHICVNIDLPDQCYPRMDFSLKRYTDESVDSVVIQKAILSLEKAYLCKFSSKRRAKFKRSCYLIYVFESVVEDHYQDAVFISGQLRVAVKFQED